MCGCIVMMLVMKGWQDKSKIKSLWSSRTAITPSYAPKMALFTQIFSLRGSYSSLGNQLFSDLFLNAKKKKILFLLLLKTLYTLNLFSRLSKDTLTVILSYICCIFTYFQIVFKSLHQQIITVCPKSFDGNSCQACHPPGKWTWIQNIYILYLILSD